MSIRLLLGVTLSILSALVGVQEQTISLDSFAELSHKKHKKAQKNSNLFCAFCG